VIKRCGKIVLALAFIGGAPAALAPPAPAATDPDTPSTTLHLASGSTGYAADLAADPGATAGMRAPAGSVASADQPTAGTDASASVRGSGIAGGPTSPTFRLPASRVSTLCIDLWVTPEPQALGSVSIRTRLIAPGGSPSVAVGILNFSGLPDGVPTRVRGVAPLPSSTLVGDGWGAAFGTFVDNGFTIAYDSVAHDSIIGLNPPLETCTPVSSGVEPRSGGGGTEPNLTYTAYPAPAGLADSAGEPSIGWTGASDAIMFQAQLDTSEVHWDDSFTVPVASWTSRPSFITSNTTTADPILATDPATGRTLVSQLAAACSGASFTDDDGETYQASTGCPAPNGVDHQTVGYGPVVPGSPETLVARQGRMAYYCSQELVAALCGASTDGGQSFGPASPSFTRDQCSSAFHGHVKVGPDGAVYLPNERCFGQAITRSLDNGKTFTFRQLPADFTAIGNLTHPSISVSRAAPKPSTAAGPGVVYYGNGDAQGRLIVTTSADRGDTWSPRVDVTAGLGLKAVDFPVVQAGDPNRAAVSFLGTKDTAAGNYSDVGYGEAGGRHTVAWHLYVAHTYDRGATWTVVDTTPSDPAQRGCLWTRGTTVDAAQTACRNLLDFNGITVDGIGRVLVGWADGCTGPCSTSTQVADNARTARGAITRQTSGRGLYAVDDGAIKPGTVVGVADDLCASGPQLVDPEGDAVNVLGNPTPAPSEPQLDVRSLLLSSAAGPAVTLTLEVEDLRSSVEVPSGSPGGVYYDLLFSYGGQALFLTARRDARGVTDFTLGAFAPTRTTLAKPSGSFDEVADTITVQLTAANIDTARAAITTRNAAMRPGEDPIVVIPGLAAGATFSALGVTARRNTGAAVPDIDSASSTCTFTLSDTAAPVVPEIPFTALLPLSALGLGGAAWVIIGRRRRSVGSSTA